MTNHEEASKNVSKNAIEFAAACFEINSISELEASSIVDVTDCKAWDITPEEWRWAIGAALYAKKNDGSIMGYGRVVV